VKPPVVVEVELIAFGGGRLRQVEVPAAELAGCSIEEQLERVFYYGQNDFQPRPMPSVSVGDVVRLGGKRWRVASFGFDEVLP
jgi:hypothetical protein